MAFYEDDDRMLYPPTIVYGCEMPELRLRQRNGTQVYFCIRNSNLHLEDSDFESGTFEMGNLLGRLCEKHCVPSRGGGKSKPCPAFALNYKVGRPDKGLATVEMRPLPDWEACAGVRTLLDTCQTDEERFFLKAYLEDKYADESEWRDALLAQWNASWYFVPEGWAHNSRRAKFDRLLWSTLRFPALIPQVWLNWLSNASEADLRLLDENPSRVDFLAFSAGNRHVIEIDGPSHYADYNGTSYKVDERAYARNLKIERSLRADGWGVTRIARVEVQDAKATFLGAMELLSVLPFYGKHDYPATLSASALGVPEINRSFAAVSDDDIPF